MTALNTTEQYSLRWNNFHENLSVGFHSLLQACDLVDVTLAVDGHILKAHKLVLSICSPYFKKIFKQNPCTHPTIIIQDVSFGNVRDILNFMYSGEVNVTKDNLPSFLRTAELLQVKGLSGDDWDDSSRKNELSQVDNDDEIDSNYTGDDVDDSAMPVMDFIPTTLPTAARLLQPIQVPNEPPPVAPCRRSNSMFTSPASAKRKRTDNEFTNHHGAANSSPLNYSDGNLDSLRSESSIKKECQEQDFDSEIVPTKCEPNLLCTTDNGGGGDSINNLMSKLPAVTAPAAATDRLRNGTATPTAALTAAMGGGIAAIGGGGTNGEGSNSSGSRYVCEHCHKRFTRRDHLRTHEKNIHGEDKGPFACNVCEQIYKNAESLRKHIAKFHSAPKVTSTTTSAGATVTTNSPTHSSGSTTKQHHKSSKSSSAHARTANTNMGGTFHNFRIVSSAKKSG